MKLSCYDYSWLLICIPASSMYMGDSVRMEKDTLCVRRVCACLGQDLQKKKKQKEKIYICFSANSIFKLEGFLKFNFPKRPGA